MKKLLKIRFVKFEKALTAQQLEAYGFDFINDDSAHIRVCRTGFYLHGGGIFIAPQTINTISSLIFNDNARRDKYLKNVVKWISKEQFSTGRKLEIGKMCEVSGDGKNWNWGEKRLVAVLPENFRDRYIVWSEIGKDLNGKDSWCSWAYARPIASCVQPKIDGDVYTWEMEVSE